MIISSVLLWLLTLALVLPLAIFTIEVCTGLRRGSETSFATVPCSIAILMPAHNEAGSIAATLTDLMAVAPRGCRIVVVADNCTDDTAARARANGVEAIERHDDTCRGKGYALAFGKDFLAGDPPDVVIVLDADCRFQPGSIERLASETKRTGCPAQAFNTLDPDLMASPAVQISSFAMIVKNVVRSRGMARLGGASLLTGTGMAFSWPVFRDASLATGNIVEDLALGIELTRRGIYTHLVPGAAVHSASAHVGDLLEQRSRWERGFLAVARQSAFPTIWDGVARRSRASLILGLHLVVPPLAMLISASFVGLAVLLLALVLNLGPGAGPVAVLAITLGTALVATVAAWVREGRDTLSLSGLVRTPGYVLWKLPMYLGFARSGPSEWVRTRRRSVDRDIR